jgi:toxin ParE1/3/4
MPTRPPIEFRPEAAAEVFTAWRWYTERSETAATRFTEELGHAIDHIAKSPERWPMHIHGSRRYRMHRFPYLIVYRLKDARIQIIACQHGRRKPGYWRNRLAP